MNNEALPIFKVLADETRLKILRALDEKESYVELLAERLSLTPATVSFHMKKLLAAGLVDARREQYYTIYSIRREFFRATLQSLIFQSDGGETAEELREEAYRRKVIRAFMPDGVCRTMPAQLKKRLTISTPSAPTRKRRSTPSSRRSTRTSAPCAARSSRWAG